MRIKRSLCYLYIFFLSALFSCHATHSNRVVIVQPLGDFPLAQAMVLYSQVLLSNPTAILRPAIPLPAFAFYAQRNRYKADTIIRFLDQFGNADTVIIGITDKDISTVKGTIPDWGVMGLGNCPGNACVVSTFRLGNVHDQLYKLELHELGHTQGLPHCTNKTCYMRDAAGGNHLDEETGFCSSCAAFLKKKGWRLGQ